MKMKQVYETNPALGDPMSIQGQLTDNGQRLDKLRSELKKYQVKMLLKPQKKLLLFVEPGLNLVIVVFALTSKTVFRIIWTIWKAEYPILQQTP